MNNVPLFFAWDGKVLKRVQTEDVTHIVTVGNYLEFYRLNEKKAFMVRCTLSRALEVLPKIFVYISRSTVVSVLHIDKIEKDILYVGGGEFQVLKPFYRPLIRSLNFFAVNGDNQQTDAQEQKEI